MFTRKQRLANECTHSEYYAQFVTPAVTHTVLRQIGRDAIMESTDPHFNDIRLSKWDALFPLVPANVATKIRECGDYPTLAGMVCLAKEAARQIKSVAS